MIINIINLPFWWHFAIWVTVPYFSAFGLFALKNVSITNRWTKKFGLNRRNRTPIIKSSLFRGLFDKQDEWMEWSIVGLIVFSVVVIIFKEDPGVIKWGYIGSLVGLLVNSISVLSSQKSYNLRDDYILPKIVKCLKKWQSKDSRRLKTIPIESVLARLADKDSIRSAAIEVLDVLNATNEQFFLGYINALNIPESGWGDNHIMSAIEALGELKDERAFNPILEKLDGTKGKDEIRSAAIIALTKINPPGAFDYVLANLNDKSSNIRSTVVIALGQIGDKRAIGPLLERLADTDEKTRLAAVEALKLLGAGPEQFFLGYINALKIPESESDGNHIKFAIEALGELKDERAFNPILEKLGDKKVRTNTRSAAITALGTINPINALDHVLANLNDESSDIRITAVKVLGQIGDKRAIGPLLGRLADRDEKTRLAVVEALELLGAGPEQFVLGYINALKIPESGWDDNHLMSAIKALGKLRDERAFNPILERLEDKKAKTNIRCAAIIALAKINPGKAFDYVLANLNDESSDIRSTAVKILGQIGDERAIPSLEELLSHTSESREEEDYGPYGESLGSYKIDNPEFKIIKNAIEMLRIGKTLREESFTSTPTGLNVGLAKKAIITGKIDIKEDLSDSKLTDFLELLKTIGLTDIVVFGGVIKDIFFGEEINDIDITIKMKLTDEEIESFTSLDSCANERVFEHSKIILNQLAERLHFKLADLLPPSKGKRQAFQGLDIDYFGPVKTNIGGKTVIVKRSIFDSATRRGFYSNTGAAILKIAIDADGNLYGNLQALGDLLGGKASILGDGVNFGIIDILKLLRLKHQCALTIDSAAYSLMKDRLKQYETRQANLPVLKIVEESIHKVITSARFPGVARKELEDLGIFTIVEMARQDIIEPTSALPGNSMLETKKAELQHHLEDLKESLHELEETFKEAQAAGRLTTVSVLEGPITQKKSQIKTLEQRLQKLPNIVNTFEQNKEIIERLTGDIQKMEAQVSQKESEVETIKEELSRMEQDYHQINTEVKELKEDYEKAKDRNRTSTAYVLEGALKERMEDREKEKAKLKELKNKAANEQQELDKLTTHLKAKQDELTATQKVCEELERELAQLLNE